MNWPFVESFHGPIFSPIHSIQLGVFAFQTAFAAAWLRFDDRGLCASHAPADTHGVADSEHSHDTRHSTTSREFYGMENVQNGNWNPIHWCDSSAHMLQFSQLKAFCHWFACAALQGALLSMLKSESSHAMQKQDFGILLSCPVENKLILAHRSEASCKRETKK